MTIEHLENTTRLDELLQPTNDKIILLFKHSTRCPVSTAAENNFLRFAEHEAAKELLIVHLDLIAHREVSNAIATKLGVAHQSPQAFFINHGKAVWHRSHLAITEEELLRGLQEAKSTT